MTSRGYASSGNYQKLAEPTIPRETADYKIKEKKEER